MKINILTKGFLSPTARGWLHPVVKNKSRLFEMGVDLSFYLKITEEVKYCDVVIIESRFVKSEWNKNKEKIFELLLNLKTKNNKVFFYDLGDSTFSWVLEVLPYVDKLLKPFIFKDKSNYCKPLDGCNIITHYYFKNGMIESDKLRSPVFIKNPDKKILDKIQLGFNASFADHSCNSNLWKYDYLNRLRRQSFKIFSKRLNDVNANEYIRPSLNRKKNLSCRMSLHGYSNGIEFHRKKTAKILSKYLLTNKLNRKDFFSEIRNSKIVISPFGWGEINVPRDYEVALSGALLLKPDLSHLETWPNIFNKDTVVQYKWDFSDLSNCIEKILDNYNDYIDFAIRLQDQYKNYSYGNSGREKFCEYFIGMLKN